MACIGIDEASAEIRAASSDLLNHLAFLRIRRLAFELRYREDQPRAPRGIPIGGQWVSDAGHTTSGALLVAALRSRPKETRCDGFSSGCQNGGSFGASGMIDIDGRRLCWDCTIKWLGIQQHSRDKQLELIKYFDPAYRE